MTWYASVCQLLPFLFQTFPSCYSSVVDAGSICPKIHTLDLGWPEADLGRCLLRVYVDIDDSASPRYDHHLKI